MTRGLIVASGRSGAGKTTVTLGLLRAFRDRGIDVRAAKSGPDYIDGAFHAAASGHPSFNLDSWAMTGDMLRRLARSGGGELLLVEAAMGLFDGAGVDGPGDADGSAAALARTLGLPVLLVLDAAGQGQSAAAVALGFRLLDPTVRVGAVLLNRVASPRHRARIEAAMPRSGLSVFGVLGRDDALALPERHLGLIGAAEHADLDQRLDRLGQAIAAAVDLDAVAALAAPLPAVTTGAGPRVRPPGQRIALARDTAFCFVYPHLLAAWRDGGATILPFSPLADEAPDPSADCVWLPGGYPELHAGRLAAAGRFRGGVRSAAERGAAVHGECGGFMVLGEALEDADGVAHRMLGLLGHRTSFRRRALHLGYRRARLEADCALGRRGDLVAGHEFHHATILDPGPDPPLATVSDGDGVSLGPEGSVRGTVSGTFFHLIDAGGGG